MEGAVGRSPPPARPDNRVGLAVLAVWLASGAALWRDEAGGVLTFVFVVSGWVLAVMAHEFAHAGVAFLGGDVTVGDKGYLAFDPRRYGNLQVSLLLPLIALALGGIGFPGGAVYLRNDLMRGPAWRSAAALAGPAATLLVLVLLALVLLASPPPPLYAALAFLAFLQATALVLNLLPVPGLDGFNALRPFLPRAWASAIDRLAGMAVIALLAAFFWVPGASLALFGAASLIAGVFGVPHEAWIEGYRAFHFWGGL